MCANVSLLSDSIAKDSGLTLSFWFVKSMTDSTPLYKEIVDVLKNPQYQRVDVEVDSEEFTRYSLGIKAKGRSSVPQRIVQGTPEGVSASAILKETFKESASFYRPPCVSPTSAPKVRKPTSTD